LGPLDLQPVLPVGCGVVVMLGRNLRWQETIYLRVRVANGTMPGD
jgi:hypothetical protein